MSISSVISKRPWLMVIGAFVILITAWTFLIVIAVKNRPQEAANPLNPDAVVVPQKGENHGQ
jgi:hypothetical protein